MNINVTHLKLWVEKDQLYFRLQVNGCYGQGVTQTTD